MIDQEKARSELEKELKDLYVSYNLLKESLENEHSDRKRVEDELLQQKRRFQLMLEYSSDILVFLDEDGYQRYISPSAETITGFSIEELRKSFTEVIHPEDVERVRLAFEDLLKNPTRILRGEYRHLHKDGGFRHFEAIGRNYLQDPYLQGLVINIRDVTERKQAEDALKKSEEKYRTIYENIQDVFYQVDNEGVILDISPSVSRFAGFNRDEIIGNPSENLYRNASDRKLFLDKLAKEGEVRDYELMIKAKNGTIKYVSVNARRINDAHGKPFRTDGLIRDITDRKLAEQELREKELNYRLLADNMTDTVWLMDMNLNFVYASPSVEKVRGFSLAELKQFSLDQILTPASLRLVMEVFEKAMPKILADHTYSPVSTLDLEFYARDGSIHSIESKLSVIRDENGKPINILGQDRDITDRKLMEKALKESEMSLERAQEIGKIGSWDYNLSNHDLIWSKNYYKIFGYEPYQIQPTYEFFISKVHPDDVHLIDEGYNAVYEKGEAISQEMRLVMPDGSIKWILNKLAPVFNEEDLVRLTGVSIDITEIKHAEKALKQSMEKHKIILQTAMDGFWLADIYGNLLEVNDAYCQMSGYSLQELQTMCITDLEVIENAADTENHLKKVVSLGEDRFETRHRRKDGTVFEVEICVQYKTLEGGKLVAFLRDITAKKQAENEILHLNNDLDLRVRQRTAELEEANKELETFSYSISHDLKAPLRHINGFITLFLESLSTKLAKEELEYLNLISSSASEMGQLIDAILSFSKLNRYELKKTTINSSDMVGQVIKFFEPETQNRTIRFKTTSLPDVIGDEDLIRLVWTNLISNAIKYTGKTPEAVVEIGGVSNGIETTFFVKDNGAGFNMKYAGKLFGPFHRLHKSVDFEGVGIGLANVNRIVSRHGGHCSAEGEPDKGATFYFSLPCVAI